jgi:hypothetical protein
METPTVAANKKKVARLGAHIVFADESGFLLIPHVAKTWAPVGPSSAPELNPDEGVWSQAKRQLSNSCPKDIDELMEDIIRSINKVRRSQRKLRGCIEQSELPSLLR